MRLLYYHSRIVSTAFTSTFFKPTVICSTRPVDLLGPGEQSGKTKGAVPQISFTLLQNGFGWPYMGYGTMFPQSKSFPAPTPTRRGSGPCAASKKAARIFDALCEMKGAGRQSERRPGPGRKCFFGSIEGTRLIVKPFAIIFPLKCCQKMYL